MTKVKKKEALLTVKKELLYSSRTTLVGSILMVAAVLLLVIQIVVIILMITYGLDPTIEDEQTTYSDEDEDDNPLFFICFVPALGCFVCVTSGFGMLTRGLRTIRIYQEGVGYSGNFLNRSDKVRPWSTVDKVTVKPEKDQSMFDKELYRLEIKAAGETISEVLDPDVMKKVVKVIGSINMTKLDSSALKHMDLYGGY